MYDIYSTIIDQIQMMNDPREAAELLREVSRAIERSIIYIKQDMDANLKDAHYDLLDEADKVNSDLFNVLNDLADKL